MMPQQLMISEAKLAPFTLYRTGAEVDGEPTIEQWYEACGMLQHVQGSVMWVLGDLLNYGEHRFGEMYTQAMEETPYQYQTLVNAKSICGKIQFYRRRENLSFTMHAEVANLPDDDQDRWLSRAEAEGWSTHDLRQEIKASKQVTTKQPASKPAADPTPTPEATEAATCEPAAPDNAPDPPVIKDMAGNCVPKSLEGVFLSRRHNELINAATRLRDDLLDLSQTKVGTHLRPEFGDDESGKPVCRSIEDVLTILRVTQPYAVCGYCSGESCEACRESGFTTKSGWKNTPQEMRQALSGVPF